MILEEFINLVKNKPVLEKVWKEVAKAALTWCAASDAALLKGEKIPPTEEFDKAWSRLLEEATGQGIVFEERVFPHDATRIIAR